MKDSTKLLLWHIGLTLALFALLSLSISHLSAVITFEVKGKGLKNIVEEIWYGEGGKPEDDK